MYKNKYLVFITTLLLLVFLIACSRTEVEGPDYELQLKAEPQGAGKVNTSMSSLSNEVTLEAKADDGYVFQVWMEDGKVVSSEAVYRFAHIEDKVLTAVFKAVSEND